MWNLVVLLVLMSLAGVLANRSAQHLDAVQGDLAAGMAAEMGIYRTAVVRYFAEHDVTNMGVSTAALKSGGYLPAWSRMAQQSTPLIWSNYRDAGGVVYVYATSLPPHNLGAELARLAHNSVLVGAYSTSSSFLQSPVEGNTKIPVSALAGKSVPDGAPVWIATRQ